jgi:uncharacterized membrane-anchored protein YjiN (DUF445 family)
MKHLPIALLALMAFLFLLTLGRPEAWAGWLNAFAEAGMVGALADWFAVVALFRHPLGLPIPHTAIIPRRKDAIGDSLARFVAEHFLQPDLIRMRLQRANLAGSVALWLKSPAGRAQAEDLGLRLARILLGAFHEERVRGFIGRAGRQQLAALELAPLTGRALEWLVADNRHRELITQALRVAVVALHDNRARIRHKVQQGSPWWLPGFVDDRIAVEMLDRIETQLLAMSLDPDHSLRRELDLRLADWAGLLQQDRAWRQWGERLQRDLLNNPGLPDFLYRLWADLAAALEADLEASDSRFRRELAGMIELVAARLESDPATREWINERAVASVVAVVGDNREAIAGLISETVRGWDAQDTSARIEAAIGRDLQFIRVNGTLVGGLVGLALHGVKMV